MNKYLIEKLNIDYIKDMLKVDDYKERIFNTL